MIQLTLSEIAGLIGGRLIGNPATLITGSVETDSRLVSDGSLFFAKPGEVTDGHEFVAAAKSAGAVAAVVEREVDVDIPQLVVGNSVTALGLLAKEVLQRLRNRDSIQVIGITGSNGKTTTKNFLAAILMRVAPTVAPIESYNNKVGAPISILRIDEQTRYLIVEMGAAGSGSISYLTDIAQPDIGIILKVGMAHAGEFGGIEQTTKIKSELVAGLKENATAILNADDSRVAEMAALTDCEILWFGSSSSAQYRFDNPELSVEGTSFDLIWPDGSQNFVKQRVLGEHHIMNALAAASAADRLGVPRDLIAAAIAELPMAEKWRMQLLHRPDGLTVINDAYNASPESMRAALQTLAQLGRSGKRTIAVLGEMAELGEYSNESHDGIGRLVVRLNIDQLVVVGDRAKLIHMGASQEGSWDGESKFFASIDEALQYLRGMLTSEDIVLVKSSKSANLRFLGDDLMEVAP